MRKFICLTLLLSVVSLGLAHKAKEPGALESMVATELAFAKMAKEQGTRPAFAAFIAADGILFRPTAVKGKEWLAKNPAPASDKHPWLRWYPAVAVMAESGDMGYTTGPWEFRPNVNDAKAVAFGNFLTVWKKQADGSWKFAIDLGISNPAPDNEIAPWQALPNYKQAEKFKRVNVETQRNGLRARDGELSAISAAQGAQKAFDAFAASDIRVFRNNKLPFIGKTAAVAALPASSSSWTWEPAFADVSSSGDLGYTYGTYRISSKDAAAKLLESGNYYRIWKKQGNKWLAVTDLLDPVAADKKN